jgi:hypothetical protein
MSDLSTASLLLALADFAEGTLSAFAGAVVDFASIAAGAASTDMAGGGQIGAVLGGGRVVTSKPRNRSDLVGNAECVRSTADESQITGGGTVPTGSVAMQPSGVRAVQWPFYYFGLVLGGSAFLKAV